MALLVQWTHCAHCELYLGQDSIYYLISAFSSGVDDDILGIQLVLTRTLCSIVLEMTGYFPFSYWNKCPKVPLERDHEYH